MSIYKKFSVWNEKRNNTVAFFHPQCNNLGGGEKVLWCIVNEILKSDPKARVVIYSDGEICKEKLLRDVDRIFKMGFDSRKIIDRIEIAGLKLGFLTRIPFFKLWSVNLGAMVASIEALLLRWPFPKVFVETGGYSFSLIPARILPTTKHVSTYIHYPQVRKNNIEEYRKRGNYLRYLYLKLFSIMYYLCFKLAHRVVVNSNWTRCRFEELFTDKKLNIKVCYPPIFKHKHHRKDSLETNPPKREETVISLAQFRPEKNQILQIKIFSQVLKRMGELIKETSDEKEKLILINKQAKLKLKICGTSQKSSSEYFKYIDSLNELIKNAGLKDRVELIVDSTIDDLNTLLSTSRIAIHTMEEEHFGICVAEFLYFGLLTISHKSGGPETDILKPYNNKQIGFLASDFDEYVEILLNLIINYESPPFQKVLIDAQEAVENRFQDCVSFGRTCRGVLDF
ncbi:glycosyl transferase [Cryptosporidium ryanae]|uniref:glycosyl transferase n=1 Tax=Cryptosporidium ryanae TaxID=515981 RepID=UPI00351A9A94|nr:glycosyl transferase [Cryptosporidium ryanae]